MLTAYDQKIHARALKEADLKRLAERNLVETACEAMTIGLYRKLGREHILEYIQTDLKFDCGFGYQLHNVVQRCIVFPVLRDAFRHRGMTVSKAAKFVAYLKSENAERMVNYACTHTYKEVEAYVAGQNDLRRFTDRITRLNEELYAVRIICDESQLRQIKRVQSVLAQNRKPHRLGQAVIATVTDYLERHDPVKKAERSTADVPEIESYKPVKGRKQHTAAERNAILRRSSGCCEHFDDTEGRCTHDRYVEIHHIVEVENGGSNHPDNGILLCSAHHKLVHELNCDYETQRSWVTRSISAREETLLQNSARSTNVSKTFSSRPSTFEATSLTSA